MVYSGGLYTLVSTLSFHELSNQNKTCSYGEASIEMKPHCQKDGALLAIGTICDKLKQTDPYKSSLEQMLVQHIIPEFNSHFGHLRAKVACLI